MSNRLMPISDVAKFILEGGEIMTPSYIVGQPRDYRLHLGNGVLTLGGGKQVTEPKASFKVLPVSVREIEGAIFGQSAKKWYEVYFINEAGHLSQFMFHGFSVDNLNRASQELRYDETKLCEVIWNIRLVEKTNKATNSTYFMAEFSFEEVTTADLVTLKAVQKNIAENHGAIYRQDTRGTETIYSENWGVKEQVVLEVAEEVAVETVVTETVKTPKKATTSKKKATKKEVAVMA
ncbi:MAG: hypothetical protein AB8G86_16680 [Saprospiraceae bacterium]